MDKTEVIANCREMMDLLFNTTELEAEQATLLEETQLISDMVQQTIYENAHIALDQTEYQKRYDGLTERFEKAKARLDAVTAEIHQMQTQRASIEDFLKAFAAMPDKLTAEMIKNNFIAHGSDIFPKLLNALTQPGSEDDRPPAALQ